MMTENEYDKKVRRLASDIYDAKRCESLTEIADAIREAFPPPPDTEGTVEVRAACAVNFKGDWSIRGWDECDRDEYIASEATGDIDYKKGDPLTVSWITARVPLPAAPVEVEWVTETGQDRHDAESIADCLDAQAARIAELEAIIEACEPYVDDCPYTPADCAPRRPDYDSPKYGRLLEKIQVVIMDKENRSSILTQASCVNSIGRRIRMLRQHRRMQQQELAQAMGSQPSSVCRWESGKDVPNQQTVIRIADALRVHPSSIDGRFVVSNVSQK